MSIIEAVPTAPPAPLAYSIDQALQVFPVGRTKLFELLNTGSIRSFKVGSRRLIPASALIDFIEEALDA